jgi:hypothetical protein
MFGPGGNGDGADTVALAVQVYSEKLRPPETNRPPRPRKPLGGPLWTKYLNKRIKVSLLASKGL